MNKLARDWWSWPAVRLDGAAAAHRARELARDCLRLPAGRARDELLWRVVAPRLRWQEGPSAERGDLSVGQLLVEARHLADVLADANGRGGGEEDRLAAAFERLLTSRADDPVRQALAAVVAARQPTRDAARPALGSRRRFARAVAASAPAVRDAHRRLRQAVAQDPLLGRFGAA